MIAPFSRLAGKLHQPGQIMQRLYLPAGKPAAVIPKHVEPELRAGVIAGEQVKLGRFPVDDSLQRSRGQRLVVGVLRGFLRQRVSVEKPGPAFLQHGFGCQRRGLGTRWSRLSRGSLFLPQNPRTERPREDREQAYSCGEVWPSEHAALYPRRKRVATLGGLHGRRKACYVLLMSRQPKARAGTLAVWAGEEKNSWWGATQVPVVQ